MPASEPPSAKPVTVTDLPLPAVAVTNDAEALLLSTVTVSEPTTLLSVAPNVWSVAPVVPSYCLLLTETLFTVRVFTEMLAVVVAVVVARE